MDNDLYSEFGGEIEEMEFPEFGEDKGRVVGGIEREMIIYKMEMQEWKREFEQKKKEIIKMEKKKWSVSTAYQGEEQNRKADGLGILFFVSGIWDGDMYEGTFKNDKRHGKGIYHRVSGERYQGEWKDGSRHGRGAYYWPTGAWEEGEWKNGKQEGKAVYHFADGNVEEIMYENGKEVK